jgi:hypothetical protein
MYFKLLDAEQRRIYLDACQVYQAFTETLQQTRQFKGGMRWKKTGDKEYLFKTRDGRGNGKSIGVRSSETEAIYTAFHQQKQQSKERLNQLQTALSRQARLAVAIGINRVPKTAANVVRILGQEGLLGQGLTVLGTHALYGYEAAAGVQFDSGLLATMDIDLLFDAQKKLKLRGEISHQGLIGLLKKADASFELAAKGHYRAVNNKGFMVELIKTVPTPPTKQEKQSVSNLPHDLVAAEIEGLKWLDNAPSFKQMVIGADGVPVEFVMSDPRYFALHKLWLSQLPSRETIKKPRDFQQAQAVATIARDYLGLSFAEMELLAFPAEIRAMLPDFLAGLAQEQDVNDSIAMLLR